MPKSKKTFSSCLFDEFLTQKFSLNNLSVNKRKFKGSDLTDALNKIHEFITNNKFKKFLMEATAKAKKDEDVSISDASAEKFDKNVKKLYECDFVSDSNKVSDPMAISRCAKILGNLIKYMGGGLSSHPLCSLNEIVMSFAGEHERALSSLAFSIKSVITRADKDKKILDKSVGEFAYKLYECKFCFSNWKNYKELWGDSGLCMTVDILENDGMENFVKLLSMAKELKEPKGSAAWVKCKKRLDTAYEKFSNKNGANFAG